MFAAEWDDDAGTPRLLWPHQFVYEAGRTLDFANEYLALFALRFIGAIRPVPPRRLSKAGRTADIRAGASVIGPMRSMLTPGTIRGHSSPSTLIATSIVNWRYEDRHYKEGSDEHRHQPHPYGRGWL